MLSIFSIENNPGDFRYAINILKQSQLTEDVVLTIVLNQGNLVSTVTLRYISNFKLINSETMPYVWSKSGPIGILRLKQHSILRYSKDVWPYCCGGVKFLVENVL